MAELIDKEQLAPQQQVELFEGGKILLSCSTDDPFLPMFIELDAQAATLLYDFLLLHMERIEQHAKVIRYNRQMGERNRIARENVEKPWLPLHDGE